MNVPVKLFAAARQLAGQPVLEVELAQPATVGQLRQALAGQCPALKQLVPHLMFAIDKEYAADDVSIPPDAEVACIPPVSGG
jgi:molybdopterin converting factor subunit 1